MHIKTLWTLSRQQMLGVLAYAAAFALFNSLGGGWTSVSIIAWAPLLPVAYVFGGLGACVRPDNIGYLAGAVFGIAIQSWLLLSVWAAWRRRHKHT